MAKSIVLSSGSLLCGSPIVFSVMPNTINERATFHRVKMEISAALSTDSSFDNYIQSAKAKNGVEVAFDVSSTLRSVASKYVYEYQTTDRVYPYLIYELKVYDEYMIDGILHEKEGVMSYGSTLYAYIGEFTDIERYLSSSSKSVQRFSRKPKLGEVCATDELLLYPTTLLEPALMDSVITTGQKVNVRSLSGLSGVNTFDGHTVYVVPSSSNRIQFQFVNKLGVVESISVEVRKSLSYETITETDTVSVPSAFCPGRRILSRKGTKQQTYAMSTGALNEDWADWWINEFLDCTKGAWVKMEGIWVPCEVIPEDTIIVSDETTGELCTINFTIRLALSGGFRNRL
ncbi:hypothetical protein [Bacteroides sp.]|uniref:hypothetical protein n=1 Tax=Bacteroides sp. TaxID=29523 RepID=UPI0026277111|nr:hypothetical protein [Bacteroides sp.]MDD3037888.1 hypothetical protein [Bacteroides sp.]